MDLILTMMASLNWPGLIGLMKVAIIKIQLDVKNVNNLMTISLASTKTKSTGNEVIDDASVTTQVSWS
jgi:hypothetical protein